jgi:putative oxidoreductase
MMAKERPFARAGRDAALLTARLLMAFIFLHEGIFLAANFDSAAASMARLDVPATALGAALVLQLAAGLAVVLGFRASLAALALALFCLTTALMFHNRFAIRDELLHFEKDIAMAGGLILLAIEGAGAWSIDASAPLVLRWVRLAYLSEEGARRRHRARVWRANVEE